MNKDFTAHLRLRIVLVIALFGMIFANSASAVTIATSTKSVDITCSGSCDFWDLALDPDGFNASAGSWLAASYGGLVGPGPGSNNSNANRLSFVNTVLGFAGLDSFATQSASSDGNVGGGGIDNPGGSSLFSWTGSGQYYLAWSAFDPRYILIRNNSENNTFTWDGKGLSGLDAFGTVAPIPLPPAVLMLLAGLGGLIVIGKRKSRPV